MEVGQRDQLSVTFLSNSTKHYRIVSCNKSKATGQISIFEKLGIYHEPGCIKSDIFILDFPCLSVNYLINTLPTKINLKYTKKTNYPHNTG